ncbi:MAG: hypothetical protein ACYCSX_15745 [Acidimicrobiales bacterium]
MGAFSCLPQGFLGDEGFPVDLEWSCSLPIGFAERRHRRPGCDHCARPYLDEESLGLVESSVASLVAMRGSSQGDAAATLSALCSLIAEAQARLPDGVADARDAELTWRKIAARLASSSSTIRRRYGSYVSWRSGLFGSGS